MKKRLLLTILSAIYYLSIHAQTIMGLDVSHYQGTITWSQVKNPGGKTFAWAKATEGTTYTDPNYVTNATNGTTGGVVMGAYHFAHPETNTAASEASYFVSVAGPYIGAGYLPPALDLEDPPGGTPLTTYFTSAALTTWVQQWMTAVQNATGVKPVIYVSGSVASFLNSSLNTYGLWIADPDGSATAQPANIGVWTTWMFKQYSWTGTVSGISGTGNNDLDVFNGTTTAFNNLIGTVVNVTPAFTASTTTVCAGSTVTFADHSTSTGTITAHSWTFGGGTPGTSTAANPTVTYSTAGTYDVKEVVTSATGKDSVTKTSYIHVIPTATLPLVQTFQTSTFPPAGWTMNFPSPVDSPWHLCTYNGYNSSQCMYFPANCGYTHSIAGQRQQLYTPDYSFVGTTNPKMWFEVAYEPYNNTYSDTLAIYYSTDCGTTWNNVYLKGGMTLCSTGFNVASGTDTSGGRGCFAPPNAQAWRADTISLASLAGNSSVMFSIESRSGWGNILYLDNINVASTPVVCTPPATPTVQASPALTNCGPVQLTAASSGCTGCTYSWSNNATTSVISATATGTYTVTAINSGCASSATSVSVTVNQPPTVTVSPSAQQVCAGVSVTLAATGNATGYQWSGTGLQTNTGSSVNAVVSTAGSQAYTVTATLNSCTATASTSVTFNATVAPAISISQTTTGTICAGSQVVFNSSISNGGTTPVYHWTSGTQTGTGSTFTLNNATNGATVKCELISNANCASPDSVASNILTIAAQPVVQASISIATPDTNVCSGENIAITSSINNGGNSAAYSWYVNGTLSGTGSGYTINNIQAGSAVYCVLTSSANCVTGLPATSNVLNIHIQTTVQASVSIQASSDSICAGQQVTFTATPGNGGNSPTYTWKLNGSTTGNNTSSYTSSSLNNGDMVLCNMVSSSTCVTNPNVSSNTITIQVNPLPVANAGGTLNVVSGASATLGGNPSANGGTSPYTYLWSPATGLNSSSIANPVDANVTASIVYTLTVTDAKGCSATNAVDVNIRNCTLQTPVVQVNFCDMATPLLPGATYQWLLQGSPITGANTRFYSVSASGYYNVKVTDTVGCSAQSADTYMTYPACLTTGIEQVSDNPAFDIYPNPASAEIEVSFSNISGNATIEIFDVCGQLVYSGKEADIVAGNKYNVNISKLADGPYLLRVTNNGNRFSVKRFIKM